MAELSDKMIKALKLLDQWGGDVSPDMEDALGCRGAAMDCIIGGLIRRDLITIGAWGTYPLTDKGRAVLSGKCPVCNGTGQRTAGWDAGGFGGDTCSRCEGAGYLQSVEAA